MADIELVIKIDENIYRRLKSGNYGLLVSNTCAYEVLNATPLEKHDEEIIKETVASIWGKPPCDDCVSREAVIKLVKKGEYDITGETDNEMFLEEVNKLPSVQPKSKTGHWIIYTDCEGKTRRCVCDQCGYRTGEYTWKNPNFCANCGARMESEEMK